MQPEPASHPIVLNQLGAAVATALECHQRRPRVLTRPIGAAPWQCEDADILLTAPDPAWVGAPRSPPPGWPGRLRWVQTASAGVDTYPRWLTAGPVVTCGRGHSAVASAEYALAAILSQEKRLESVSIRAADGWQSRRHTLGTLQGRTLGLAGYGEIGRATAARARAFGMRILAWRRTSWPADDAPDQDGECGHVASLADLAAQSDHLVLALPLTDATRHCVDAAVLAVARPGMHLINVARGGLVDQTALLDALDAGRLGFATLDVTDPEPLPELHPIYRHPRIRLTPHISWSADGPDGARAALTRQILFNLDAYLGGGALRGVVDPERGY